MLPTWKGTSTACVPAQNRRVDALVTCVLVGSSAALLAIRVIAPSMRIGEGVIIRPRKPGRWINPLAPGRTFMNVLERSPRGTGDIDGVGVVGPLRRYPGSSVEAAGGVVNVFLGQRDAELSGALAHRSGDCRLADVVQMSGARAVGGAGVLVVVDGAKH